MTVRRGRRYKQLLDNRKETRGYWKLKEEALHPALRKTLIGRDYGPVLRQTVGLFEYRTYYLRNDEFVFQVTVLVRLKHS